jgi:AcrR family transcriptional regulator
MANRAGLNRGRVLEAAAELADAEGPEGLALGTLAGRLGIRTPSLYHYVDGLPGLQRALSLMAHHMLAERLARASIGKARDEAIIALADAFRGFIKEHPGLYALTVRSALLAGASDAEMQQAQEEVLSVLTAVAASYHLNGEDALHAIRGLRSIGHGFATLEAAGGFGIALDLDESYHRLVRMYLAGLQPAD